MKGFHTTVLLILVVLISAGCNAIDKSTAEANAVRFIDSNVKFFAREENSTLGLSQYSIDSVTSYQEGKNWVVAVHISAQVVNGTKKNDLIIKLNKKGEVIEFNGNSVPTKR